MTTQNPTPDQQEPFIPPSYMLILAGVGLLIALLVAFTQPTFTVIGWGGLGIMLLSLLGWVFMAPDQARAILTGRTALYGSTTVIVTVLVLVALIGIYAVVKGRNIRVDLTQRDTFSLNEQTRQAVASLAVEPNIPSIKILAFYSAAQASRRDQDSLLFDDYQETSGGKITYEFIDPDRSPVETQTYSVTRAGQVVVAPVGADGQPDAAKAQLVDFLSQEELSNAILRVAASGDFRAYFLSVEDGLALEDTGATGLSDLNDALTDTFNWKTQEVNYVDLANPAGTITLNDPLANGEVLVIVGGSKPFSDEQIKFISDYVDAGGDLVVLAAPINDDSTPTLATADNLNTYLFEKFGMRFINNVVVDEAQAFETPFSPVVTDLDSTQFITSVVAGQSLLVFALPRSIEVAPTLPENVTVTELARSGVDSYAKTDPALLQADTLEVAETDAKGPFVLAAAAENAQTGARVVLIGSMFLPANQYNSFNVGNTTVMLRSIAWVTRFDEFFNEIQQLDAQQRPEDTPIFVDSQKSRNINFAVIIALPFGILAIGFLVWWNNRERARA
ncbi:MAG: GldG family protein [Anaerolineae bacterium]|nr:GldG family protein [Anaerolineae bacterium]